MKKKTLTIAIALVLVVALAVGATWAYLKTSTTAVTNTFTVGKVLDNDEGLTLKEHAIDTAKSNTSAGKYVLSDTNYANGGNQYDAVMPGVDLPKDPTVAVTGLKADAYLFVVVDNNLANGLSVSYDAKWATLKESGTKTLLVYKTANQNILKGDVADANILANNTVTVDNNIGSGSQGSIVFNAYLVQAGGFNSAAEAWDASFAATTGITAA